MTFRKLYFSEGVFESSVVKGVGITVSKGWLDFKLGEIVEAVCAEGVRRE